MAKSMLHVFEKAEMYEYCQIILNVINSKMNFTNFKNSILLLKEQGFNINIEPTFFDLAAEYLATRQKPIVLIASHFGHDTVMRKENEYYYQPYLYTDSSALLTRIFNEIKEIKKTEGNVSFSLESDGFLKLFAFIKNANNETKCAVLFSATPICVNIDTPDFLGNDCTKVTF